MILKFESPTKRNTKYIKKRQKKREEREINRRKENRPKQVTHAQTKGWEKVMKLFMCDETLNDLVSLNFYSFLNKHT